MSVRTSETTRGRRDELTPYSDQQLSKATETIRAPVATPGSVEPNVEQLRRWIADLLRRPFMWESLREGIEFEDPEDLSGFLEVIRDAEMACSYKLQDLNQQIRQDDRGGDSCLGLIVRAEESAYWNGRIHWLQASRAYLEKQQRHHEAATGRVGEGEL